MVTVNLWIFSLRRTEMHFLIHALCIRRDRSSVWDPGKRRVPGLFAFLWGGSISIVVFLYSVPGCISFHGD